MPSVNGNERWDLTVKVAFRYHPRVTPDEVRAARKRLGLTQSQFATLLGVHLVTVKKWETGAQGMRPPTDRLIRLLDMRRPEAAKRKAGAKRQGRRSRREVP